MTQPAVEKAKAAKRSWIKISLGVTGVLGVIIFVVVYIATSQYECVKDTPATPSWFPGTEIIGFIGENQTEKIVFHSSIEYGTLLRCKVPNYVFSTSIQPDKLKNNTISIYADGKFLFQRSYNCSENAVNTTNTFTSRCDPEPFEKDCIEISGDDKPISAFECFGGYYQWHTPVDNYTARNNATIQVRHKSDVTIQNFISQNAGDLSQLSISMILLLIAAVLEI
eukprot:NODE_529_length_6421_cov_0.324739.p1 type:complete len:224 gc:universal NODE_529_length_6421_cov_0.324739:1552-881(-)